MRNLYCGAYGGARGPIPFPAHPRGALRWATGRGWSSARLGTYRKVRA